MDNSSKRRNIKVLLIIDQCNPEWASVPLEGYHYYRELSQRAEVTLVTHERNKSALEKTEYSGQIFYITESKWLKKYYDLVEKFTSKGTINWPLQHALTYPAYASFNRRVDRQFKQKISNHEYDIVHAITPMMPRYPVKIVKRCHNIPFILGPVNGGVPFPDGFREIARQEFVKYNFLRAIGRKLIPGYVETYKKADRILAGSSYTLEMLKNMFKLTTDQISLFYENGITKNFLINPQKSPLDQSKLKLLFVGRLVPYKGADILLEAIAKLAASDQQKISLDIVGDGSEKSNLVAQIQQLKLTEIVNLVGWVEQEQTLAYYQKSHLFCFPSIREFGGAVVLEAMACGLPCLVANNGGIGEYVTEKTGFKIAPISRDYLVQELANKIEILLKNPQIVQQMSANAIERSREFEWGHKAEKITDIYRKVISEKKAHSSDFTEQNQISYISQKI